MKKYVSNSGNRLWTGLLLFLFLTQPLFAGVPFSISGTAQPGKTGSTSLDDPQAYAELIGQLKLRAVQEWLQGQLGERYPQFERLLNQDFSERYILDYKVARSGAGRDTLTLTGHLDSDSLKKWIRLQDTRKGTTSLKPLLLFSSNINGFTFTPVETGERIRDSAMGQTVLSLLTPVFTKTNSKPIFADRSTPLSQPARFESDLGMLRDYCTQMGTNAALWAHLQACAQCTGGARLDLFFYSIPASRLAVAESEDLNIKPQEWNHLDKVKAALTPVMTTFQVGVETLISSGQFYSQPVRVIVEGLENYRIFKAIDSEFSQSDFTGGSYLKKAGPKYAEFEVLTQLSTDELVQRIQTTDFAGLRLKAQRFDSRTVVVRYAK